MQPLLSTLQDWHRPFWLGLLIISSVAFTLAFACAVPFAAFAAATALTLRMRDALVLMTGVWLANQLVGFTFLDYPLDTNTLLWGAALLGVALCCLFAARMTAARLRHLPALANCAVACVVAFVAYEASCYGFALILGGCENFTLPMQARVLGINACALVGLFALNHAGASLRLAPGNMFARSHA